MAKVIDLDMRQQAVDLVLGFAAAVRDEVDKGWSIPISDLDFHKVIPEIAEKCGVSSKNPFVAPDSASKCPAVTHAFPHPFSRMMHPENLFLSSRRAKDALHRSESREEIRHAATKFIHDKTQPSVALK